MAQVNLYLSMVLLPVTCTEKEPKLNINNSARPYLIIRDVVGSLTFSESQA